MTPAELEMREADLDEAGQALTVTWGDGHSSRYPLEYLRSECPCAGCRTARQEARTNPFRVIGANERPPVALIRDVEPVGNYGMRILWKDGHSTGIYTFEHLRQLCPCDECRGGRPAEEAPFVHGIYIPR